MLFGIHNTNLIKHGTETVRMGHIGQYWWEHHLTVNGNCNASWSLHFKETPQLCPFIFCIIALATKMRTLKVI